MDRKGRKEIKMATKSIKWMSFLILGCILVCLFGGLAHAQLLWDYSTGGSWDDWCNEIVRDPHTGKIYAVGRNGTQISSWEWLVVGLDNSGNEMWTDYRSRKQAEANAVCLGLDGYIYVAGYIWDDDLRTRLHVVKYNAEGATIQSFTHDAVSENRNDQAFDICYGPDHHLYVAGRQEITSSQAEFVVVKLDTSLSASTAQFYTTSGAGGTQNKANVVKVDASLNVWAAGVVKAPSSTWGTFTVVKLDTALIQDTIYHYGDGLFNGVLDLAFPWDGSGGVYAAGYSSPPAGLDQDITIISIDVNGQEEWVYKFEHDAGGSGIEREQAEAVVSGPGGYVYAAGWISDTSHNYEYVVVCLNSLGEEWVYIYEGSGEGKALDISIDSVGKYVYATGYTEGSGGYTDIVVTKHDSIHGSTPYWVDIFDFQRNDGGRALYAAPDGKLYLGGNEGQWGSSRTDFLVAALPQNHRPSTPVLISPNDDAWLNDTTVTFIWRSSDDAETSVEYILQYDTAPSFTSAYSSESADTAQVNTLVDADVSYYWRVKARDDDGKESAWSQVWSFAFDLTPPDIPSLTSPIGDAFVLDTSVTFYWGTVSFRDSPSPVRYALQIDTNTIFPNPIVNDTFDVNSTTIEFPYFDDRYYWRVKAFDIAGNDGSYSSAESFRVDLMPPLIESTTVWHDTSFIGPFSVYTKTTDLFGVDIVFLYFKRMEDPVWFPVDMSEGAGGIYFEEIPQVGMANDTVKYYISAKDDAGYMSTDPAEAPIDYYWFIAGYDPGVMEYGAPIVFSFGLKSNPARGKALFNLALPEAGTISLRIYDVSGRLIDNLVSGRKSAGHYDIPWTSGSTAGVYFYRFESPWKTKIGKLVLVR